MINKDKISVINYAVSSCIGGKVKHLPAGIVRRLQDVFGNRNMLFYYSGVDLGNGRDDCLKIYCRELKPTTKMTIEDTNNQEIKDFNDNEIFQF